MVIKKKENHIIVRTVGNISESNLKLVQGVVAIDILVKIQEWGGHID